MNPLTTPQTKRSLALILAVFFALSLVYNWASPLFENSDEFFHFPFIKHLADSNWYLPVQSGDDLQDWRQQGSQPPIYHMIAALLIKPIDTSDYAEVRRINPHAQIGIVGESNINAVVHPMDRSQEWENGTALAVRVVRMFSTLLASVVVICAYYMTVLTFPMVPRWVGLLAAALVAFNPMYLFVASSINNDNMSNALIATVLVLLVWLYRQPEKPPVRVLLTIGVLLGLSMLSKLSTGPFMLLVGLYWLVLAWRHQAWAYMIRWGFATLGIALLISGWWYIRNWQLYGDPTGLNTFLDIVGRRPIPLTAEQLWSEREGFIQSFWGLYGGLTVNMPQIVYTAFSGLAGLSVIGALMFWWQRIRQRAWRDVGQQIDLPQITLVLWAVMAGISLIRWTALTWATQGRLWFVAITALAALSTVGFYHLATLLQVRQLAWLPAGYALIVALVVPFAVIRPAYAVPELTARATYAEAPLQVFAEPDNPDAQISLLSVDFPTQIETGDAPLIDLTLCAETRLNRNWSVFVHLLNPFDIIVAQADFTPGQGAIPTSEIEAEQCWQDRYPIEIPAGIASEDTPLRVLVGFYDARTFDRMARLDASDDDPTRYVAQQTQLIVGDEILKFVLGDALRITDYELSAAVVNPGDTVTLTVDWEVLAALNDNYTAFVQIIDLATAYRAGASDKAPDGGTRQWQVGDIITDGHQMTIADDAPPGVYAVLVGFYRQPEPGQFDRLRVSYDGVDTGFDALTLTQVRVEAP